MNFAYTKQSLHPQVQAPLFYPWWQQDIPSTHVSVTQASHQGVGPTIKHNAPSRSCNKSLSQSKIRQRRTCKNLLKNSNIKETNQIYYSSQFEHSLIIHQIPANSA